MIFRKKQKPTDKSDRWLVSYSVVNKTNFISSLRDEISEKLSAVIVRDFCKQKGKANQQAKFTTL